MEAGKRMLNRALVTNGRRMVAGSECQVRRTANGEMLRLLSNTRGRNEHVQQKADAKKRAPR